MNEPVQAQPPLSKSKREIALLQEQLADREHTLLEYTNRLDLLQGAADERAQVIMVLDKALNDERRAGVGSVPKSQFDELSAEARSLSEYLDRAVREREALAVEKRVWEKDFESERLRVQRAAQQQEAELTRKHNREMQAVEAKIQPLYDALEARSAVIAELKQACDDRLTIVETLTAEIASLRVRESLPAERALPVVTDVVARDGTNWRNIAEQRQTALEGLSKEAERRAVLLAEVTAALQDRTREVEELRRRRGSN
jgi:hypothetical protein